MTATAQVHPLRLGSAANEFVLVIHREHAVPCKYRERRDFELFPFLPARFMHRFKSVLHDVGVEPRHESAVQLLKVRNPSIDYGVIAEELSCRVFASERGRPRREPSSEADSFLRAAVPAGMPLKKNKPLHTFGVRRRDEECCVRTNRLPHEHAPLPRRKHIHHRKNVLHERRS